MLARRYSETTVRGRCALILGCSLAFGLGLGTSALGKPIAGSSGFCSTKLVHDYQAPFTRMKPVHSPPASGKLPFGPRALTFQSPEQKVLVPGVSTHIAYAFQVLSGEVLPEGIDWTVGSELTRVNAKGETRGPIRHRKIQLATKSPMGADGVGFEYSVGAAPSFYLATIRFMKSDGEVLAKYEEYFRVVAAERRTTLVTDHRSIARGETLWFRVENSGTALASCGEVFEVEQEVNGQWIPAGLPLGPWRLHILGLGPGEAGPCQSVSISPEVFEVGNYRVQKELRSAGRAITAKFAVVS
jgi:hypothetical protein